MEYQIIKNRKSKSLRIRVHFDGRVVVTIPYRMPKKMAVIFVNTKKEWIQERVQYFAKRQNEREASGAPRQMTAREKKQDYENKKEEARKIITNKVETINKYYGFKYGKIAIRNQRSRWGSCSKKGNLNFNYKIAFLSNEMLEYVVVHELCHLKEFNHGARFWVLVSQCVPDYKNIRNEMKKEGMILG